MTWALTKSDGSGTLSYRLLVEAWPYQWVTHQSMVDASATPPKRAGLSVRSGKLKCVANIASGELDVSGFQCSVVDDGERATEAFAKQPTATTWLASELTSSATTATVRSVAGLASSGTVWLDSEAMTYTSTTASTGTISGLTRGALSTLAQKHYVTTGGMARYPEVTNLPVTMAGKRAYLYVYGEHDSPTGAGTLIWTGIVSRHPTMKGGAWSISVDPITSVLSRAVSADLGEPVQPRGIYYPDNWPCRFRLVYAGAGVAVPSDGGGSAYISVTGFFETNDAFRDAVNTAIAASPAASWDTPVYAVSDGDAGWHLECITDGTPSAVFVEGPGGIDPVFGPATDASGTVVTTFGASQTYYFRPLPGSLTGAGTVPRGYHGRDPTDTPVIPAVWNPARIYVGGAASLSTLTSGAQVEFPAFGDDEQLTLTSNAQASAATRYVVINTSVHKRGFTSTTLPSIRLGRTYTDNGSIWTAISAIISATPDGLNAGAVPDLRSGDFDSSAWDDLDAAWQSRIIRSRVFRSFTDVTLGDLITEELKLAGYVLGLTSAGLMAPFRLRPPVTTEAGATATKIVVSDSLPVWQPSALGQINQVRVRRGYRFVEDEYAGATDIVRDVTAFGQSPRPRTITIEPKSTPSGPLETHAEIVECAVRLFSVLSGPYAIVQWDAPLTSFDITTGSIASITSTNLPDSDGTRGVTSLPVLVTGREIDLAKGVISFTGLAMYGRSAGYAPDAKLTGNSNISGNTYDLTCDTYTFPSGTTASTWFAVGYAVRVHRWDSTTAGTLTGTVVSGGSGNVVRVTFSGAWTPGADTWLLSFDASTAATSAQLAYAYMADSAGRIDASTDIDARTFS